MASSPKDVLSIRLVRELAYQISRLRGHEVSRVWVELAISLLPILVGLLLSPFGHSCQGIALGWLLEAALLNWCLLEFPQLAWSGLIQISDAIDDMLTTPDHKSAVTLWEARRLQLRPQIVLSIVGGCIGIVALKIAAPLLAVQLQFCFASYVSVFLSASLGANAIYWLWAIPLLLRRLAKFPSLQVCWICPVNTPGIRELSSLLGLSAVLSAIGVGLFTAPLLWVNSSMQSGAVTSIISTLAFLASLGTVFFIAVFPQYWLSAIIYRERYKVLDQLSTEIQNGLLTSSGATEGKWPSIEAKVNVYEAVNATRVLTVDIATISRYVLAAFTTGVPYIIEWLL